MFNHTNGYTNTSSIIYGIAKQMDDNGIYFPLFGTCLGFELLFYASNNNSECRVACSSNCQPLPLEFTNGEMKPNNFVGMILQEITMFIAIPYNSTFQRRLSKKSIIWICTQIDHKNSSKRASYSKFSYVLHYKTGIILRNHILTENENTIALVQGQTMSSNSLLHISILFELVVFVGMLIDQKKNFYLRI